MRDYLLHGLSLRSPVSLLAPEVESGAGPVDVRVRVLDGDVRLPVGDVAADCRQPATGYAVLRDDASWHVVFPGTAIASFDTGTGDLALRAAPHVDDRLLPVLLAGPVMSVVAVALGHTLLHASSVTWGELGAVAITGPRGSGKSSLARLLVGDDRALLSDDALRVDSGPMLLAHRGTTGSRLRSAMTAPPEGTAASSADGRVVVTRGPQAPGTAPLRLVARPVLSAGFDRVALRRLHGIDAVSEVVGSWPIDGVVDETLLSARLSRAATIAAAVPVMVLEVPWNRGEPIDRLRGELLGTLGDQLASTRVLGP